MIPKLLSRLTRARTGAPPVVPPSLPDGTRVYAIGDIHGRLDLLDDLLQRIEQDETDRGGPPATLIFLGDLIDRGPESAQVVERAIAVRAARPDTRFLMGNHEEVFLDILDGDRRALRLFDRIGGKETILSYGMDADTVDAADFESLSALVREIVPERHRIFLAAFEAMIVLGDYVFVHAGIRPGVPLAEQTLADLRWIKDEFTGSTLVHEKVVVHGHTISPDVVDGANRIGLDTGAYKSARLSAMGFEGQERWIVQTRAASTPEPSEAQAVS